MLQAIREHAQGWIAKVILGLIALTFAVWGVDWYFTGSGQGKPAAEVGDTEISERDFAQTVSQQQEAMGIRPTQPSELTALRRQVIDQMIGTELMRAAAESAGLTVSEAQIQSVLGGIEAFQEQGQFSEARLDNWLRSRGMSRSEFLAMLRQDVLMRQIQFAYGEGAAMPAARAGLLGKLLSQEREVQELVFATQSYINGVKLDDTAVAAHYEANKQNYALPAQVRIAYLTLSLDGLKGQSHVTESEARQYYEANSARYQEPEQRRASHILLRADPNDAAALSKARAEAERLLKEVKSAPDRFAELAGKHSQDPVSAAQGGDLGNFTRETMVKPFADTVFSMKAGEISNLVQTEFGFHIIRLTSVTPGTKLSFDVVKPEILEELSEQAAQRKFAETADRFGNMVYEQPDNLDAAAKEFQLTIQESGWIAQKPGEGQTGPFANERLLEAVFSSEAIEKKQNTEAIEVAPNTLVSARVLEHRPEGVRPLAEVAAGIKLQLTAEAARKLALAAGESALKTAQAGQALAGLGPKVTVSRMQPQQVPPEGLKAIFRSAAGKLPAYVGTETRDGYRLYRINQVAQPPVDPQQAEGIRRDMVRLVAQEELRAYMEHARSQARIKINQDVVDQKAE